jgi:RND family efflux transporter MFP subunit
MIRLPSVKKKSSTNFINLGLPVSLILLVCLFSGCSGDADSGSVRQERIAPVAVVPITTSDLELRRTFSGTLSARTEFVVAPKVSGLLESISVDIGDRVELGQVVATIDNAEFSQEVAQAEADLAVAQAELIQARSALEIGERETRRVVTLLERGVASDSQYDSAQSAYLAAQAQFKVAEARVQRAESSRKSARIRLGYTRVHADWTEGDDFTRVVAERFLDEGQTVASNDPILLIVQLDPIVAVIYVTEKDYGSLKLGQVAQLITDAYPGDTFTGVIERIAPVFRESTRQARIEIRLENPDYRLRPGMFVRTTITLERVEQARIIPESALTVRNQQTGVFLVDETGKKVIWKPVTPGISQDGRIQILEKELKGRVVTLGQHLIDDGSPVVIAREKGNGDS